MAYVKTENGKVPYVSMKEKMAIAQQAQQQAQQQDQVSAQDIEQDAKTFYQKYKIYIFIVLALLVAALGYFLYTKYRK